MRMHAHVANALLITCSMLKGPRLRVPEMREELAVRSIVATDILPVAQMLSATFSAKDMGAFDSGVSVAKQAIGLTQRLGQTLQFVVEIASTRQVAGYAELWTSDFLAGREIRGWKHEPPEAYVSSLVVAASARRRGVATALMGAIEERSQLDGCGNVSLQVEEANSAGVALYESLGYATIGRDGRNTYRGLMMEPRIALRKELPPRASASPLPASASQNVPTPPPGAFHPGVVCAVKRSIIVGYRYARPASDADRRAAVSAGYDTLDQYSICQEAFDDLPLDEQRGFERIAPPVDPAKLAIAAFAAALLLGYVGGVASSGRFLDGGDGSAIFRGIAANGGVEQELLFYEDYMERPTPSPAEQLIGLVFGMQGEKFW